MPDVIIGIKKFNQDHRNEVQGMLAASFEAADQLKAFPEALKRAAAISAKVYNEQTGAAKLYQVASLILFARSLVIFQPIVTGLLVVDFGAAAISAQVY